MSQPVTQQPGYQAGKTGSGNQQENLKFNAFTKLHF
jgi:hypothetical protein